MSQSARRRAVRHQALRELVTQTHAACCSMQCNFVDTTALLLGFDEGTLGQILPRFHHHTAPTSNFHAPVPRTLPNWRLPEALVELSSALSMRLWHRSCAQVFLVSATGPNKQEDRQNIPDEPRTCRSQQRPVTYPATPCLQLWLLGPWISDDPPPFLTTSAWDKKKLSVSTTVHCQHTSVCFDSTARGHIREG